MGRAEIPLQPWCRILISFRDSLATNPSWRQSISFRSCSRTTTQLQFGCFSSWNLKCVCGHGDVRPSSFLKTCFHMLPIKNESDSFGVEDAETFMLWWVGNWFYMEFVWEFISDKSKRLYFNIFHIPYPVISIPMFGDFLLISIFTTLRVGQIEIRQLFLLH